MASPLHPNSAKDYEAQQKYAQSDEDLSVVLGLLGFLVIAGFSIWGLVEVFIMPVINALAALI